MKHVLFSRKTLSQVLSMLMVLILFCSILPIASAEEPVLQPGGPVTVDGVELPSGAFRLNELPYARLSEITDALGVPLEHEGDAFGFDWRKDHVSLASGSAALRYLEDDHTLAADTVPYEDGTDLLVPIESFCKGAQIGYLYDEEFDHIYCTPGAGNWEVEAGHNVPIMMSHGVGHGSPSANLFVNPETLEKQFVYLLENGYTPIWFEDLEHVEDYEKPVILTFDDGWRNNYSNLLPLVKKYQVKVTIFMVCSYLEKQGGNHLDKDQALEMYESGYISFQSHMYRHVDLRTLTPEKQERQMLRSRLYLTRLFGKEPCAMSYPYGGSNKDVDELARQYYHFATKMYTNPQSTYNTSDDPVLMYRFFPQKKTPMKEYKGWLKSAFPG